MRNSRRGFFAGVFGFGTALFGVKASETVGSVVITEEEQLRNIARFYTWGRSEGPSMSPSGELPLTHKQHKQKHKKSRLRDGEQLFLDGVDISRCLIECCITGPNGWVELKESLGGPFYTFKIVPGHVEYINERIVARDKLLSEVSDSDYVKRHRIRLSF